MKKTKKFYASKKKIVELNYHGQLLAQRRKSALSEPPTLFVLFLLEAYSFLSNYKNKCLISLYIIDIQ